jgi:amino acid adenylation domain-containing protein
MDSRTDSIPVLSPAKQALLEQRLKQAVQDHAAPCEMPRRRPGDTAPLSFPQQQMWVIDQITPGNPAYNLPYGYRLLGALDVAALEASFNEIVKRHESLRTTFGLEDGESVQRIHPGLKLGIGVTWLDHLPVEERERKLQILASEESIRPFDLSRPPLIRVSLFRLGAAEHVLIINLHHIVADGLSVALMLKEVDAFYRAFTRAGEPSLLPLPAQYADFALWQRRAVADGACAGQREFWRRRFPGRLPVLELPGDFPRPPLQSFRGSNVCFDIPETLARDLQSLGAREGCTFFMTVLAAFQVLLQRYSGAEDIIVGTPVAARTAPGVAPLIGNFLNMVALRCDVSGNPPFIELLRRTRDATLDAFSNSELPFQLVLEHLKFERDPCRNPVFQAMLQVLPAPASGIGEVEVRSFEFDRKIAQVDLSLHLYEEAAGYRGRFEYCTDLFCAHTVERLASNFRQLLRAVVGDPGQRISRIPVLAAAESQQILFEWNDTRAEYPADALMHQLFEAQAARTPGRIALKAGATALSYVDLDVRANRLAHALRSRGIGRGRRVGLCVERGADMVAAVLGILKAGAAYVPLDPSFPEARLRFMAEDAGITLLVSTGGLARSYGLPRERQLLLDADSGIIDAAPAAGLPVDADAAGPGEPAYVIYTSGSTGVPKGVVIPHRAVVNFLSSMAREPGLTADDVLAAVTTLSFDIAVLELHLPLTLGATVVIASREDARDGAALRALLERHRATVMQATPATWRLLLAAGWRGSDRFKALVGGETLPGDLADQLLGCGVELWNMYGPTETTVWSTCARITGSSAGITIGRPIANTVVRILGPRNELCPVGVPGELCIGGAGVALGYWNRPELTAERFVPDPYRRSPWAVLYRTGDRARWRADGTLEHLGRLDFQIKLRGFRIEPGEIESVIARHSGVREAAVVAREDAPGDQRLVAYVAAGDPPADLADPLRSLLRAAVPEYMIPAHIVTLAALPRTANGKLDRKALPAPAAAEDARLDAAIMPRTPTEHMVLDVFRDVLRRTDFGIQGNFFDLGGHSLTAARMMLRLRAASGRDLPSRLLFERQTVSALAEAIDALAWLDASRRPPVAAAGDRVQIEL